MSQDDYSWLLKLALKLVKYFLLGLFSVVLVSLLLAAFGGIQSARPLAAFIEEWLPRLTALVVSVIAAAIVFESLRQ